MPYFAAQAIPWPDSPDNSHKELLEVTQPDPFSPAAGTATPLTGLGTYPSGGVTSRPGDWERHQWLMHDD